MTSKKTPYNINNFNKILINLDKTNSQLKKNITSNKILNSYTENKLYNTNFNGKSLIDPSNNISLNFTKNLNDYMDFYTPEEIKTKENINITDIQDIQNIQNIQISINVETICDLLEIINNYKNEPNIKYNINVKALHQIKEPLLELNSMIGINELKKNITEQILYFIQDLHKNTKGDFLHTVIYGPPGTGKTEIAKIVGKIYSSLGILSKGTFKKVTRSDLIAGFLGQTALKTKTVIDASIGGVLFIDEAYSLGNKNENDLYSKECIDTLCEALSDNKQDLMVIIAGYEKELNECFFNVNNGLNSRFIWRFNIDEYTANELYEIFIKKVEEIGWQIYKNEKTSTANLNEWFKKNKDFFPFYGRDIENILLKIKIVHSKRVFGLEEQEKKKITIEDLENGFKLYLKNNSVNNIINERKNRRYLQETMYC